MDLEIEDKHFTITDEELGKGSYGTVYAAVYYGKPCVAKEMHPHLQSVRYKSPQKTFMQECKILSRLNHPSIVQFFGVYYKTKSHVPILIMERLWKNLDALFKEQQNQMALLTKAYILLDVACGLQYLHDRKSPIIHRDINTSNVMLTKDLTAKIIDLGQAKISSSVEGQRLSSAPGHLAFMAPETLMSKPNYDTQADVFSFGCIIVHAVTEKFPVPTDQFVGHGSKSGVFIRVSEMDRRKGFIDLMCSSPFLQQLACQCLEDMVTRRPTASYICAELEKYIQQLETESPTLVKRHKEDKLALLHPLQFQEQRKEEKLSVLDLLPCQGTGLLSNKYPTALEAITNEKDKVIENLSKVHKMLRDEIVRLQLNERVLFKAFRSSTKKADALESKSSTEKTINALESNLYEVSVLQDLYEMGCQQQRQERQSYVNSFKQQSQIITAKESELSVLKQTSTELKQQLEENSHRLNEMELTVIELQKLHSKGQDSEEENVILRKVLENSDKVQSNLEKDLVNKEESLKRKEKELDSQTKMHKKEKNSLKDKHKTELDILKKDIEADKARIFDQEEIIKGYLEEVNKSFDATADSHSVSDLYQKHKATQKENVIQKKLLEKYDRMQRRLEKDLMEKEKLLERKENIWKNLHDIEMQSVRDQCEREIVDVIEENKAYKSEIDKQEEIINLLKQKEAKYKSDLEKSTKDKYITKLENDLKSCAEKETLLKMQIKFKNADINQKRKYIESLEKNLYNDYCGSFNYDVHWYPYLSLSAKLIRPSVAIIKDKVFLTSGYPYGLTTPQGMMLEDYLMGKKSVFCFNLAKCRCDTIDSPVQLGALANVNSQCVLVSGADNVGNTLTGNVYVLCEEGSHNQWKKMSKPLPTPRILACACCYSNRWLIVCGGYKLYQESNLLDAINLVEILDTTKGEWYILLKQNCPNVSTILCCAVVKEDVYVVGTNQVIKTSCNNLIKAATSNSTLVWDNVQIETEESSGKLYPFSVVEVNGEPMIIASMTDGEDDVTCVLMKDTRGRWRIMSKAVECQHGSAAVMTSSLELLLFGGSTEIKVNKATEMSQKGHLIPILNIQGQAPKSEIPSRSEQNQDKDPPDCVIPNQPPNLSFTGPIHTIQFDHNGGTFQSPIHKVSLVVPPNALSDGEKVTVYMGATTSGPFDLPEDCKLRSAVVWLSGSTNITFKKSIALVMPHSVLLSNPEHLAFVKFHICEEFEGAKYQFRGSQVQFEIGVEYGLIKLEQLSTLMVAIVSECKPVAVNGGTSDHINDDVTTTVPTCYLAKLFWPPKHLPASFRADIFCIHNLPTEIYKVDLLYKKYYKEHGMYPEVLEIEFTRCSRQPLKCILPCSDSGNCDCFTDWDVTQLTDNIEVDTKEENTSQYKMDPIKFSFKFNCRHPGALLTCCFELQGAKRGSHSKLEYVPECLKSRFSKLGIFPPMLLGSGKSPMQDAVTNGGAIHGTK